MNGQMKKYKDSLSTMQGPILLSQCPDIKLDLRGLMKYAAKRCPPTPRYFILSLSNLLLSGLVHIQLIYNAFISKQYKRGIDMINVMIDEFTPCLKDARTGELVQTEVIQYK